MCPNGKGILIMMTLLTGKYAPKLYRLSDL